MFGELYCTVFDSAEPFIRAESTSRTSENSVKRKFALPHSPSPDSLFYEGPHYAKKYYQSLMYADYSPPTLYRRRPAA
jgi:hypothetical protein